FLISYCLYFFFYCHRPHRHLHSFPTRRSSDLAAALQYQSFVEANIGNGACVFVSYAYSRGRFKARNIPRLVRYEEWAGVRFVDTDRKSTRLNSSHDQISYAVFCLKKKKK